MKSHIRLPEGPKFEKVIVCGAPERAALISQRLEGVQTLAQNREYHSYSGTFNGSQVLVTSHGVGAAGAAICFSELIDAGAKVIIRLGTAGGLQEDARIGDVVIPTGAIRKEGVSPLMIPLEFPAVPDPQLSAQLLSTLKSKGRAAKSGIVLTSDLFYPGLLSPQYELYQKAGAIAVEMECSALFIIGQLRQVKTASALILDGNPLKWESGQYDPDSDDIQKTLTTVIDACLEEVVKA